MTDSERLRPLRIVILNNDSETLKTVAHWFEINGHRVTTSALAAQPSIAATLSRRCEHVGAPPAPTRVVDAAIR